MQVLLGAWYVCVLLASLPSVASSAIEVGRRYRIRLAHAEEGQPAGWYLDAHRSLASDRESSGSTRVSAHEESNANWAGEWIFENGSLSGTYKIKLMSSHQGQTQGWYLDSSPTANVIGKSWRAQTSGTPESAWVFVLTNSTQVMEWRVSQATGVTVGGNTVATYTFGEGSGWFLSVARELADDSRSATSTYIMVKSSAATTATTSTSTSSVATTTSTAPSTSTSTSINVSRGNQTLQTNQSNQNNNGRSTTQAQSTSTTQTQTQTAIPPGITEWILEPVCDPLCAYDEGEGGCHVSRTYTAEVVRVLQGGTWSSITEHLLDCEAKGKIDMDACISTPGCEIDSRGRCAASRSWSLKTLMSLPSNEGLGIGEHQKCGLFGQYINLTVSCADTTTANTTNPNTTQKDVCKAKNKGGNIDCVWNALSNACEASPAAIQRFLMRNYREELAYVALRRLRCEARPVATCDGDCEWSDGRCTLHPGRSLLAVLGQACPLSHYLKRQMQCTRIGDEATCVSIQGAGGIAQCRWTKTACEPYAISLELDIIPSLGLQSSVPRKLSEGGQQCRAMTQDLECTAACAPPVIAYPPEQESGAANQHVRKLFIMLSIVLSMVKFL